MPQLGCLPLVLLLVLLALLPLVFAQILIDALVKLRLTPDVAVLVVLGIFAGSMVNIPITRIRREEEVRDHPLTVFGLMPWWPRLQRIRRETVIAVNVGGCVIPIGLALYETGQLLAVNGSYIFILVMAILVNSAICFWLAKPVPGVGIAMPAFIPPIVAALVALLLAPSEAPAVAFIGGVMGPLLGADLLHLRDIPKVATGIASIGGAGTFDGIVLSGILAAYLA